VALKDARGKREQGEITAAELRAVEDREIETLIKKQEAAGLKSITDGEYRRASWQTDFFWSRSMASSPTRERKFKFQGAQPRPSCCASTRSSVATCPNPMIEHFKFRAVAHQGDAEDDDPSPSTCMSRVSRSASIDDFYDLGTTFPQGGAADSRTCYLQLDEVNPQRISCDPELRQAGHDARATNRDKLPMVYAT